MEDDDGGVAEVLAEWRFLGAESRARLLELTYRLLVDIRWETARGFTLTDEMPLTVAAHAALSTPARFWRPDCACAPGEFRLISRPHRPQ